MVRVAAAMFVLLALWPSAWAARSGRGGPNGPGEMKWQYSYANLGYFGGRAERSDLEGNNAGLGVGGGFGRRLNRYLAWEFDTLWAERLYETPSNIVFAAGEMFLTNTSLTVNARAILPFWKLEPWIGYGFGINLTTVEIQSDLFVGATAYNGNDIDFSTQWRFGLDLAYTRRGRLGLEVRDIVASADFSEITDGDADVGGRMILFVVKIGVGKRK